MAYFQVLFQGKGIRLPFDGGDSAIGFFTTRVVRADSSDDALDRARDVVLSEWRDGGSYAAVNSGEVPELVADPIRRLGPLRGFFGRKRTGYVFYCHED